MGIQQSKSDLFFLAWICHVHQSKRSNINSETYKVYPGKKSFRKHARILQHSVGNRNRFGGVNYWRQVLPWNRSKKTVKAYQNLIHLEKKGSIHRFQNPAGEVQKTDPSIKAFVKIYQRGRCAIAQVPPFLSLPGAFHAAAAVRAVGCLVV